MGWPPEVGGGERTYLQQDRPHFKHRTLGSRLGHRSGEQQQQQQQQTKAGEVAEARCALPLCAGLRPHARGEMGKLVWALISTWSYLSPPQYLAKQPRRSQVNHEGDLREGRSR